MFERTGNDSNMLRYRILKGEIIDEFSYSVLKNADIPGVIVPGRLEDTFQIPVSDCVPLEDYLKENDVEVTLRVMKDAEEIIENSENYMLGEIPIIKRLDYAFVKNNEIKFICIPTNLSLAYDLPKAHFLQEILAVNITPENLPKEEQKDSKKHIEKHERQKLKKEQKGNNKEKKQGFFSRLFMNYDEQIGENDDLAPRIAYTSELPPGVSVLAVRSTGDEYPICFGPDIIGTNPNTCSICLSKDSGVDENHCRIYFDKGRFQLEDLGSSSGTYLNSNKLDPHKPKVITPADFIRVGKEELVFSRRETYGKI